MRGCKHHTFYKANAENPRNLEFPDLRAGSLRSPPLNNLLDPFLPPKKWLIGGIIKMKVDGNGQDKILTQDEFNQLFSLSKLGIWQELRL